MDEAAFQQVLKVHGDVQTVLFENSETKSTLTSKAEAAFRRSEQDLAPPHHLHVENRVVKLNTFVWGRLWWETLHMIAASYPENPCEETRAAACAYVGSMAALMPCQDECAPAWRGEVERHPPQVASRAEFMEWARERHNSVNRKLGAAEISSREMFARVAEQQNALAAVVYYAKKSDFEALAQQRALSFQDKLRYDFKQLIQDPVAVTGLLVAVTTFALMLIFWLARRSLPRGAHSK